MHSSDQNGTNAPDESIWNIRLCSPTYKLHDLSSSGLLSSVELCHLHVSCSVTWSITEINWSHCVHSELLPSSFSTQWLRCTDNTECASLGRESFTLFLPPLPLFPTLFNHFSALGSFLFPVVSFSHFGFLLLLLRISIKTCKDYKM